MDGFGRGEDIYSRFCYRDARRRVGQAVEIIYGAIGMFRDLSNGLVRLSVGILDIYYLRGWKV
jgi:hypothetical protein